MKLTLFAAAGLLALHLALVLHGAARHPAAFDEVVYAPAGYATLTTGDQRINPEHPPVLKLLTGAALLGTGIDVRKVPGFADADQFLFGQRLFYGSAVPAATLLFRARLAVALLSCLAALALFATARAAGGAAAGLFALALYALDPLVIAHAGLATLDVGTAVLGLLAVLSFRGAIERGGGRVLAAGAALGLALGAKFSTLPLVLVLGAIAVLVARGRPLEKRWSVAAQRTGGVLLVAFAVLTIVCLPAGATFFLGALELQGQHAAGGHPAFAFGEYGQRGWWWYYPAAWLVKTPLPLIAATLAGAVVLARRARREPLFATTLGLPVVLIGGAAVVSPIAIGARQLLPLTPFLAILGGLACAALWARGGRVRWAAPAALAWLAIGTLAVHPHELSYANEAAGGPGRLSRLLTDSNVDWGLDLHEAAAIVNRQPLARLYLAYFGAADPTAHGLPRYRWLPSYSIGPRLQQDGPDPGGREWLAVSVTSLVDPFTPQHDTYAWLRDRAPTARAGYSILLYDITGDALAHRRIGEAALALDYADAARPALLRAVALAPDDLDARLALADAWASDGDWDQAARQCDEVNRRRPGAAATPACRAAFSRGGATAGAATPPPSPR